MHQLRTIATTPTTTLFCSSSSSRHPVILRPPPQLDSYYSQASPISTMSKDLNLDAIFEQKRAVRSKVRKDLKAMTPAQRAHEDAAIQNIVLESSWFKSSVRLCAYISCSALREVDTSKILSEILSDKGKDTFYNLFWQSFLCPCYVLRVILLLLFLNQEGDGYIRKKLYVPRVEDKNSHMRMLNISSIEDMVANSMSILEPSSVDSEGNQREDVMEASDPVDLLLLPGLAFDRSGRRLGRSGGYYDMFLKKYKELSVEKKWKQPLLVGLAYELQIIDDGAIPVTYFDVPVDALVSPSGVIPITPAAMERM